MAGIGFEIRKLLGHNTYLNMFKAYGYAGVISSGPWVFSILGMLLLGFLLTGRTPLQQQVSQFQTSVVYLISSSLILSGLFQQSFTRFISDELYHKRIHQVVPNFNGLLIWLSVISSLFAITIVLLFFQDLNPWYVLLMALTFIVLCIIWVATNLLAGIKAYKVILMDFVLGYTVTIIAAYSLHSFGITGLMFGFFIGQVLLVTGMLTSIYKYYPTDKLISFDFFKAKTFYFSLLFTGLFYNIGSWADKYLFWFNNSTGENVIGPLHASSIYDIPIFLAYLCIIPGMAVFLLRMETDFVEKYRSFYRAILDGHTLSNIKEMHMDMVNTARKGVMDIINVQILVCLAVFATAPTILEFLGFSTIYEPLLKIDVVGTSLQMIFLAILNVLFYLDKRRRALILTALFAVLNFSLSYLTIHLGPFYFGYGFASSLLIVVVLGMWALDREFKSLIYKTFMYSG